MANDDLPGFIEDEPKPAAKKKPPEPTPPAPAFDPFAEVKVDLGAAAPAAAPAPAPAARPGGRPPAPAPTTSDDEAEVRPGQGKDLWPCPHCGARNKPDRQTCRSCGKSPADEVIVAWHAKPAAKVGIAVAVVGVVVLLGVLLFGGSRTALVDAGPAHVDRAPRIGGHTSSTLDLDGGRRFVAANRYAVSGRVLASRSGPFGTTEVALALGSSATDETAFAQYVVDDANGSFAVTPEPVMTVIDLLPDGPTMPSLARGEWLSLVGEQGAIEGDGQRQDVDGATVVHVLQYAE